jgi:hypothetical protein
MDIASFIALGNIKEAETVLFAAEGSDTVISAVTGPETVLSTVPGTEKTLKNNVYCEHTLYIINVRPFIVE